MRTGTLFSKHDGTALTKVLAVLFAFHFSVCISRAGDGVDDVLQHTPMASVFALKAFGMDNQTSWTELTLTAASSYILSAGTAYTLKHVISEKRPDDSDRRSFPSGHATFAFAGATVLSHEFGHRSPWITVGGYGVATLTALDRIRRDRHYWHDVCAGAAIGIAATELTYFLKQKLVKNKNMDVAFTGRQLYLAVRW